jgi:GTP pyrophosphokinase
MAKNSPSESKEALIKKIEEGAKNPESLERAIAILKENFKESDFVFNHSLRTALILKELKSSQDVIIAGLLHHISGEEKEKIKDLFDKNIAHIIRSVSALSRIRYRKRFLRVPSLKKETSKIFDDRAENLRKMFFVITKDIRPILIKLAERLDEMRELNSLPRQEQKRIALESLEIFAPLAYGLGISEIKGELEDLAFAHLYPRDYQWLLQRVEEKYEKREKHIRKIEKKLKKILAEEKVPVVDIHSRAKYYYSLYKKLLRYRMDFRKIYDLIALRIIVPNVEDCYKVLGIIHKHWPPIEERIKDYIATPKANGYQSLHTTVISLDNRITEFQIKTPRMHQEAEYGLAAHLAYKEHIPNRVYKGKLYWAEELRRLREETEIVENLSQYLNFNLFPERVFVFTPRGDVIDLPKGSTAIDFAYAIHSEVGNHCQQVKIDKKLSKLSQPLKNGNLVEIITSENQSPSRDWLKFVKTKTAKDHIRKWLEAKEGAGTPLSSQREPFIKKIPFLGKIIPSKKKEEKREGIYIGKETGFFITIAKCCSPKRGDKIKAFITKGKGASIHKADCQNLKKMEKDQPQRVIEASWGKPE